MLEGNSRVDEAIENLAKLVSCLVEYLNMQGGDAKYESTPCLKEVVHSSLMGGKHYAQSVESHESVVEGSFGYSTVGQQIMAPTFTTRNHTNMPESKSQGMISMGRRN